jgi:phospholipase/carboxylesterase
LDKDASAVTIHIQGAEPSMSNELLPCLTVEPKEEASHAIVWLHGLGDSGHGHEDVVRALSLPSQVKARFLLPHAPEIAVTLNAGMVMPAWYDIAELGSKSRHDANGISKSADSVLGLMADQVRRGIPYERQVVAGFSQGGVIAFEVGLVRETRVKGIIALSTYLAVPESELPTPSEHSTDPQVFVGHGSQDPMVPRTSAQRSSEILRSMGYSVTHKDYPMGHSICMEEIEDISSWLSTLLSQ